MRKLLKACLYFSRRERRGVLLLAAAVGLVLLAGYVTTDRQREGEACPGGTAAHSGARQAYGAFRDSAARQEPPGRPRPKAYKGKREEAPAELAAFNPNTADSATFRRLGLPDWMARNILRYRDKGGRFRRTEDFRKVYGLTEEQYTRLAPYVQIPPEEAVRHVPQLLTVRNAPAKEVKYEPGTVVELNSADTTELKKIPGIGSGIARLIVGYRQRLGGFYRIEQLREINLDTGPLQEWFSIDTAHIRRLNLNRAGVERLRAHPYINFYQARALVEHRKKRGPLRSLKPFALYEEFTEADLERIGHYVCFE